MNKALGYSAALILRLSGLCWRKRRLLILCIVAILLVFLRIKFIGQPTPMVQKGNHSRGINTRKMMQKHLEETFRDRKRLYIQGCKNLTRISSASMNILVNDKHKLAYCLAAKAGCTFWKRFFRFLAGDVPNRIKIRNPFQIDRFYVHYASWKINSFDFTRGHNRSKSYLKVVTTRDPYSRLWASYVDKFILPDFWWSHGLAILKNRKKLHPQNKTEMIKETISCPDNISFTEFLEYSLRTGNEHWSPISSLCNPCQFQPDFVARVETFSADRELILQKAHLSHLLTDAKGRSHAEAEMLDVIIYNFRLLLLYEKNQNCLTLETLSRKLWFAFQLNGYIRNDATFPEEAVIDPQASTNFILHFAKIFFEQMKKNRLSAYEGYKQRKQAMITAYRQVPQRVLDRLQIKHGTDFLLFGYNATPPT